MLKESLSAIRRIKTGKVESEFEKNVLLNEIENTLLTYYLKHKASTPYIERGGIVKCSTCDLEFLPIILGNKARYFKNYCPQCGQALMIDREKVE